MVLWKSLSNVQVRTINLSKGEQFADDFTSRNPNQKIPVLRDGNLAEQKVHPLERGASANYQRGGSTIASNESIRKSTDE